MGMKKQGKKVKSHPDNWTVKTEMQINGRIVTAGTELSITGEPGRFRFIKHVVTQECEWIDVVGGRKGYSSTRSFRPSQVRTVHWKNKTMANIVKERKEQKQNEED